MKSIAHVLAVMYLTSNVAAIDLRRQLTKDDFEFINSEQDDFPVQLEKAAKEKHLKHIKMPKRGK